MPFKLIPRRQWLPFSATDKRGEPRIHDVLGAVALMHVEIDDRDASTTHAYGMGCADGAVRGLTMGADGMTRACCAPSRDATP